MPRLPALLCAMAARVAVTAANSAMWIAAPELYPTHVRGLGASMGSLFSMLGAVPASAWVNAEQPGWVIALGIGLANVLAALFAATLCAAPPLTRPPPQPTPQPAPLLTPHPSPRPGPRRQAGDSGRDAHGGAMGGAGACGERAG